jgi:hypothetical protein
MVNIWHVWQRQRRLHVAPTVVWLLLMALPALVHAEQCTGKVVGISDGDTISMLHIPSDFVVKPRSLHDPLEIVTFHRISW